MKANKYKFGLLIQILILSICITSCLDFFITKDNNASIRNFREKEEEKTPRPADNEKWYSVWGYNFTGSSDLGNSVAYDSEGNYYMVGECYNTPVDYSFLVKFDNNGDYIWNRTWPSHTHGAVHPGCKDVAVDSSDNIYVTGETIIGGDPKINTLKFNKTGHLKWNSTADIPYGGTGWGIIIGNENYLYVAGYNETIMTETLLVLKYNMTTGDLEDSRNFPEISSIDAVGYEIAIDTNDNIYIVGTNGSILLLKINSTLDINWSIRWDNPTQAFFHNDYGFGIDIDSNNDIYLVGYSWKDPFEYNETHDGVFLKYNSTGGLIFNMTLHNQYNYTILRDISIYQDNIYVCGYEKDDDRDDVIVLKYDSTGNLEWKKYWGGDDDDEAKGITVRNPSEIVIVGRSWSYATGYPSDAFILSISPLSPVIPPGGGGDDDDDDDDVDGIIPGYDIYLIITITILISSIYLFKKLKT